jgi:fatty acid desaturase
MILTTLACGFVSSIIHEMEHDYIHSLLGKRSKLKDLAFWIVQPYKPLVEMRRFVHLRHHKYSGSDSQDFEEILVGSYSSKSEKVFAIALPMIYTIVRSKKIENEKFKELRKKTLKWNIAKYAIYLTLSPITLPWLLGSWLNYSCLVYGAQKTHNHSDDGKALPLEKQSKEHYGIGAYLTAPFSFGFCFTHNYHHHKVKVPFWKRTIYKV